MVWHTVTQAHKSCPRKCNKSLSASSRIWLRHSIPQRLAASHNRILTAHTLPRILGLTQFTLRDLAVECLWHSSTTTLYHPPVSECHLSTLAFYDCPHSRWAWRAVCISLLATSTSSRDTHQPGLAPGPPQVLTVWMNHNRSYISTLKCQSIFKLLCSNSKIFICG